MRVGRAPAARHSAPVRELGSRISVNKVDPQDGLFGNSRRSSFVALLVCGLAASVAMAAVNRFAPCHSSTGLGSPYLAADLLLNFAGALFFGAAAWLGLRDRVGLRNGRRFGQGLVVFVVSGFLLFLVGNVIWQSACNNLSGAARASLRGSLPSAGQSQASAGVIAPGLPVVVEQP